MGLNINGYTVPHRLERYLIRRFRFRKIGATRCHILRPKCTKFDFRCRGTKGEEWKGRRKGGEGLTHPMSQISGYATGYLDRLSFCSPSFSPPSLRRLSLLK